MGKNLDFMVGHLAQLLLASSHSPTDTIAASNDYHRRMVDGTVTRSTGILGTPIAPFASSPRILGMCSNGWSGLQYSSYGPPIFSVKNPDGWIFWAERYFLVESLVRSARARSYHYRSRQGCSNLVLTRESETTDYVMGNF